MDQQGRLVAAGAVVALLGAAGAGWFFLSSRSPEAPRVAGPAPDVRSEAPAAGPAKAAPSHGVEVDDGENDDPTAIEEREPSGDTGGATADEILAAIAKGNWLEVERLLSTAKCDDPRVTEALAKGLSDMKWRYKVAELVKYLKDPAALGRFLEIARAEGDDQTRSAALLACAILGGPGVADAAGDILRNARPGGVLAEGAARALGTLGTPEAARTLVDMLRQNLGSFRSAVFVDALAKVQGPEALALLGQMANDAGYDAALRASLLAALGRTRNAAVVPDLLKASKDVDSPDVRKAALVALGAVGAVDAVTELVNLVQGGSNDDKLLAARALEGVSNKAAAPILDQALQGTLPGELRGHIVTGLGRCGSESNLDTLGKIANDSSESPGMRTAVVRAIGTIGSPAGAGIVLDVFEKSDKGEAGVRRECIAALQETATEKDLPRIQKALAGATEKSPEWYGLTSLASAVRNGRRGSIQGSFRSAETDGSNTARPK